MAGAFGGSGPVVAYDLVNDPRREAVMSTDPSPTNPGDREDALALGLLGGGAAVFLAGILLGSRFLRLVGFLAGLGGGAMLAAEWMQEREEQIEEAQETIAEELAGLDPVARAQVIANLTADAGGD